VVSAVTETTFGLRQLAAPACKLRVRTNRSVVLFCFASPCSSKRAAQISHNVSAIAEQAAHHQSYQYLPSIGAPGTVHCCIAMCDAFVVDVC